MEDAEQRFDFNPEVRRQCAQHADVVTRISDLGPLALSRFLGDLADIPSRFINPDIVAARELGKFWHAWGVSVAVVEAAGGLAGSHRDDLAALACEPLTNEQTRSLLNSYKAQF